MTTEKNHVEIHHKAAQLAPEIKETRDDLAETELHTGVNLLSKNGDQKDQPTQSRQAAGDFKYWRIAFLVYGLVLGGVIVLAITLESAPLGAIGGAIWAGGAIAGIVLLNQKGYKKFVSRYFRLLSEVGHSSDLAGCLLEILVAPLVILALPFALGPIIWVIVLFLKPCNE